MIRKFVCKVSSRANYNFGAVSYTLTDTIEEADGGLYVTTRALGTSEGEGVDQTSKREFYAGVAMSAAVAYRLQHGYTEVTP